MDLRIQHDCCTPELTATVIACKKSTQDGTFLYPVKPHGAPLLSEDLHAVKVDKAG